MSEFRREIKFEPGHALGSKDYNEDGTYRGNYGRSSMRMRFLLHGSLGSVQFLMGTGWTPEKVYEPWNTPGLTGGREVWSHMEPSGWDRGHHWDTPTWDGEERQKCDCRPQGFCYYDGSGLAADPILERFLIEGDGAVWEELEAYYNALVAKGVPA